MHLSATRTTTLLHEYTLANIENADIELREGVSHRRIWIWMDYETECHLTPKLKLLSPPNIPDEANVSYVYCCVERLYDLSCRTDSLLVYWIMNERIIGMKNG